MGPSEAVQHNELLDLNAAPDAGEHVRDTPLPNATLASCKFPLKIANGGSPCWQTLTRRSTSRQNHITTSRLQKASP